jgi:hypothetical protein
LAAGGVSAACSGSGHVLGIVRVCNSSCKC